jgi:hypothetical protein
MPSVTVMSGVATGLIVFRGTVFRIRIRIRRIRNLLGLPDSDPLGRGTAPDPDPSFIKQNSLDGLEGH